MTKKGTPMEDFTVLVLRPDYAAQNYGQDTFLAHVSAATVAQAQKAAKKEAADADREPDDDYFVLLALRGHHFDIRVEEC